MYYALAIKDHESLLLPQHDVSSHLYCCVSGLAPVLVATDVASRGLDIKDITLVKLLSFHMRVCSHVDTCRVTALFLSCTKYEN